MEIVGPPIRFEKPVVQIPPEQRFQPEILFSTEDLPCPVSIIMNHSETQWVPNGSPELIQLFDNELKIIEEQEHDWTHNGRVYNCLDIRMDYFDHRQNAVIAFDVNDCGFYDYKAANLRPALKDNPEIKTNPLLVTVACFNKDFSQLILGVRSPRLRIPTEKPKTQLGMLGGICNVGMGPLARAAEEIKEEMGIDAEEFDIHFNGIVKDRTYNKTHVICTAHIDLTTAEIMQRFLEKGDKDEHVALIAFDYSNEGVSQIVGEDITPATALSLGFFVEPVKIAS